MPQKQWTRAAIEQAKGLSMAINKMVDMKVDGLRAAMRHLVVWLLPLHTKAPGATEAPGRHTARAPRGGNIIPAQVDSPSPRVQEAPLWLLPAEPAAPNSKAGQPNHKTA